MKVITNKPNEKVIEELAIASEKYKYWRFATGFLFLNGWELFESRIGKNYPEKFKLIFGFVDKPMARELIGVISDDPELYFRKVARFLDEGVLEFLSRKDNLLNELINSGRLSIKWFKNLHAKLYLLTDTEFFDKNMAGRAILGSSNLTRKGLSEEGELNVVISDIENLKRLMEWFEERWEEGEDINPEILVEAIVEEKHRRLAEETPESKFVSTKKLEKEFVLNPVTAMAFLIYYLLDGVYELPKVEEKDLVAEGKLKEHNIKPVIWGYHILKEYGGVILADPVGLGKSFQALGILALLRTRENIRNALFVVPPHLVENLQWEEYIREFFPLYKAPGRDPRLESRLSKFGGISTHRKILLSAPKGLWEILLVSSYGLALLKEDSKVVDILADYDVIVIDEAHHFKNLDSKKRRILNAIIKKHREKYGQNPYVILLTATPIINEIGELLSLLSIYTQGVGHFDELVKREPLKQILRDFEKYEKISRELKKDLSPEKRREKEKQKDEIIARLRDFVSKIMIMRSRSYVERTYFGGERPKPKLKPVRVTLLDEIELLDLIDSLSLAYLTFSPSRFVVLRHWSIDTRNYNLRPKHEGISLVAVTKILLAKRLESSVYAFLRTLENVIYKKSEKIYNLLKDLRKENKEIIARKILGVMRGDVELEAKDLIGVIDLSEDEAEVLEKLNELVSNKKKLLELLSKLYSDLVEIRKVLSKWKRKIDESHTSKEKQLFELLKEFRKQNKQVVLFTMFKDTAERLYNLLKSQYGDVILKITGDTKEKGRVMGSFKDMAGKFSVLVATDAISEGVNLESADYLINYEVPWTPAIIMQRVGRLWRITRKTSKEYWFFNFLPDYRLVEKYNSLTKIEEKLRIIREILIQEIRLLESEELTEDFESRVYGKVLLDLKAQDVRKILSAISLGPAGGLREKLLEMLENEKVDGKVLREIVEENRKVFEKIYAEIKNGKTLNICLTSLPELRSEKPVHVVNFARKYFFEIPTIIDNEENMFNIILNRWKEAKKYAYIGDIFAWKSKSSYFNSEYIEKVVEGFKNRFIGKVKESYEDIKDIRLKILSSLTANIRSLTSYMHGERGKDFEELKRKVFFVLHYCFTNKFSGSAKASRLGVEALNYLKELGVIEKKGNTYKVREELLLNPDTLTKILDKFGKSVPDIRVEVIF